METARDNAILILLGIVLMGVIVYYSDSEFLMILTISAFVFLLSVYLMQKSIAVFNISRLTIPAFWYLTYLVMIYFPSFFVFYGLTDPSRYAYLFAVESVLITVPLGIIAINQCCRFKKSWINEYFTRPVEEGMTGSHTTFVYAVFLILSVSLALLYLTSIETIPLFYMLQHPGQPEQLAILREESFKMLDPRWEGDASTSLFYAYLFLRTLIFPFLIMISIGYLLINRNVTWLSLALFTSVCGILYAAASIARAPVAAIVLRVAFFLYLFKQGRLGRRLAVILMVSVLLFPFVVTKMAYVGGGGMDFQEALKRVAVRMTYTPAADLYDYFEIFPTHHDYLYGQAFLKPLLVAIGADNFYIENYVYNYRYPQGLKTGHSNAAFQSNLHADFGPAGVIVGGFLIGMLMQGIQIYIFRKRKTVLNIALYSFMVYAFWVLNMGSVTSVLFVNGVLPVLILVLLFNGMERFFRYFFAK